MMINNSQKRLILIRTVLAFSVMLQFTLYSNAITTITLEWQSVIDTDIVSYKVYVRPEGEAFDYSMPAWEGIETSCATDIPDDQLKYFFVVRAVSGKNIMSPPSKEVCFGCTLCPDDPFKTYAGACGCGVEDRDIDVDGLWDCYDTDDDNDGIEDIVEDNAPNQGDSNLDGVLDSQQSNVGSFIIDKQTVYFAIESSMLNNVNSITSVQDPYLGATPEGIDFSFGLFEYFIDDLENGENVIVTLTLPEGITPDTYYSYGMLQERQEDLWHEHLYDIGNTGADINGNVITLYLNDGQIGDKLEEKDGKVIGLGGPGFISIDKDNRSNTDSESVSGGVEIIESGEGCFVGCLMQ